MNAMSTQAIAEDMLKLLGRVNLANDRQLALMDGAYGQLREALITTALVAFPMDRARMEAIIGFALDEGCTLAEGTAAADLGEIRGF